MKKKIFHIIGIYKEGGAEKAILNLSKSNYYETEIISLLKPPKSNLLKSTKCKVIHFSENDKFSVKSFINLIKYINKESPNTINSHMYKVNILLFFCSFFMKHNTNLIWSIYCDLPFSKNFSFKTKFFSLLNIIFSHFGRVKKITFCTSSGIYNHKQFFFNSKKTITQHLGIDQNLKFNNFKKKSFRESQSIDNQKIIFGNLGRFDKEKDHRNLFKSFNLFKNSINGKECYLFCAGPSISLENKELSKLFNKYIDKKFHKFVRFFDYLDDIEEFYSSIDIFVLSSVNEAFPNVICEAMLTNNIVISTDVGYVKNLLDMDDMICPISDSKSLSILMNRSVNYLQNKNIKEKVFKKLREKITSKYSLKAAQNHFLLILDNL